MQECCFGKSLKKVFFSLKAWQYQCSWLIGHGTPHGVVTIYNSVLNKCASVCFTWDWLWNLKIQLIIFWGSPDQKNRKITTNLSYQLLWNGVYDLHYVAGWIHWEEGIPGTRISGCLKPESRKQCCTLRIQLHCFFFVVVFLKNHIIYSSSYAISLSCIYELYLACCHMHAECSCTDLLVSIPM